MPMDLTLVAHDATDGEIDITFSGGNAPPPDYTITLTKASDPLNPTIASTPTLTTAFTNLGFGNYTAIVRDGKGCHSLPASAIIVNPPPFSPGFIGINQSICVGDDATEIQQLVPAFGGVGNYQYRWQQSLTGSINDADWIDIPGATNILLILPCWHKLSITGGLLAAFLPEQVLPAKHWAKIILCKY